VLVLLVTAFLIGTPFAALATGAWVHGMARQAQLAQEASRTQVTAVVLSDTVPPAGGQDLAWQAQAQWRAPDGHEVTREVPVASDTVVGEKLHLWTDRTGDVATAPLTDSQVAGQTAIGEGLGVIASVVALILAGGLARWALNKRRMAAWEADWHATGPRWTTRA
jgi:hypothetical protein